MSTAKKEVQPINEQDKANDFIQAYQKLCKKHGYQINVTPAFKARDDGTWSQILQTSVGKLPDGDI